MQKPLAPITHFLPVTVIRRARLLPLPGKVVVRKGQKVNTTDVLAETTLNSEHILLDIARGLGVTPAKADQFIQHQAGDRVSEGDVLAGPVGLGRRVVRAPKNGRVVVSGGGQVLLEMETRPFELRAGMPGVIAELIDQRGAEIEAVGALLQGVWGNERVEEGLLSILLRSPEETLTPNRMDVSQRGLVLVGGYAGAPAVFTAAAELPARGLILASMDAALIPAAAKMPYPVIVLEGFGKIPMNAAAYKLLTTSERRPVALNAEAWDRIADTRPEIVIPLPDPGQVSPPNEVGNFAPGKQVRLVLPPRQGEVGVLAGIRPGLTTLPSGIRAPAAEIRLESGETLLIPLANLEILE